MDKKFSNWGEIFKQSIKNLDKDDNYEDLEIVVIDRD
jgi:hypothetical protein